MIRRIVFFVPNRDPFGPFQQLQKLAEGLGERGLEIEVVVLGAAPPKKGNDAGRPGDRFNLRFLNLSPRDLTAIQKIRRVIEEISPDLIHSWCCGPAINIAAKFVSTPFVETQYSIGNCDRLQDWNPWVRQPDLFLTNDSSLVGQRFRSASQQKFAMISKGIQVVDPRGNDADVDIRKNYGLPDDCKVIMTIAPLLAANAIKDLIWACDLLGCIRHDLQLLIAGTGPQKWRLQRFLRLTDSKQHVRFIESPPERMLAGVDVYWNSILESEPDGVLTAMASGVPVVSVANGELNPLLRHQQTAMCVEPGGRDQYARWTKYFLEQTDSAIRLVDQARSFVTQERSIISLVDKHMSAYDSLK